MPTIILASSFCTTDINENRERFIVPLTDKNSYLSNIKKYITGYDRVVAVANDPANYDMNDERAHMHFQSLEMTGLHFREKIILDNRNKKEYLSLLNGADLILLCGGKLVCQLQFFREIHLAEFISAYQGLIISASAGAMTLCEYMTDFPEYLHERDDREMDDYIIKGLGLYHEILIPHFDGAAFGESYLDEGIDHLNDYILPLSRGRELIGMPDGSYILLRNGYAAYFGAYFSIEDGHITKIPNIQIESSLHYFL